MVVTAALPDTILIGVAVLGVSAVLVVAPMLKEILTLLGIVFLVWMGWKSWRTPVHPGTSDGAARTYWTLRRQIMHTLRASLLNPHAMMDTVVVIGGGAAFYTTPGEKLAYALAAVLVSWVWFFALSLARTGRWRNCTIRRARCRGSTGFPPGLCGRSPVGI